MKNNDNEYQRKKVKLNLKLFSHDFIYTFFYSVKIKYLKYTWYTSSAWCKRWFYCCSLCSHKFRFYICILILYIFINITLFMYERVDYLLKCNNFLKYYFAKLFQKIAWKIFIIHTSVYISVFNSVQNYFLIYSVETIVIYFAIGEFGLNIITYRNFKV